MSDDGIVWETPSGLRADPGIWQRTLLPLMERPGEWARVKEMTPRSAAATIQHLKTRRHHMPAGRWEFTQRTRDGKGYIYARYLGPEDGGL